MFTRPSPPLVTTRVAPARTAALAPRGNSPTAPQAPPIGLPAISSDELVSLLHHAGARVISRQPHGVLLKVCQRLVFIPSTHRVSDPTLADALRAAGITPEQFVALRISPC